MAHDALFQPLKLGALSLAHRVVMAPLTRLRSRQPGNIPQEMNAVYYGQRATKGGLQIAEATDISPTAVGYPGAPGIWTDEQVAGWKLVTDAVHAKGGYIFDQIWHTGRISHSSMQPNGQVPFAPSAIAASGKHFSASFQSVDFETPRALETNEIAGLVADFRKAAENAKKAGFDGVEVHGANGYLIGQFLHDGSNQRTDQYGGSIENRARFLLEVVDAVVQVWGADRVGVRLSPWGKNNSQVESNPLALYSYVCTELGKRKLAYVHLVEPRADQSSEVNDANAPDAAATFKSKFGGVVIAAGGFNGESGAQTVAEGKADAIAYGRHFISNPDLAERLRRGAELNKYDRSTFYGGGDKGYTDYPTL
jgi:N-ethylmaleimide reductase